MLLNDNGGTSNSFPFNENKGNVDMAKDSYQLLLVTPSSGKYYGKYMHQSYAYRGVQG